MSLDGYVAGPQQSVENPLGIGGEQLHSWAFELAAWRAPHGLTGGVVNESSAVVERRLANIGATVMGRNMFGGHPGAWKSEHPWRGWWGEEPPFHHPVFVLTHHSRPAPLEGDDLHVRHRRHRIGVGPGAGRGEREGCGAGRRRECRATVPGCGPGR